jgi:cation:H+ antiporter
VGVSPLIVGLTVVAFGTSTPEMAVSVHSAMLSSDGADIALGNVVGSNIFNVLLILGLSALAAPLIVSQQLIRRDVPIMIAISLLLYPLSLDRHLGAIDGTLLFLGIIIYTIFTVVVGRREGKEIQAEYEKEFGEAVRRGAGNLAMDGLFIMGGLLMLVLGARWLVESSKAMAQAAGVSDLVIGLTVVAMGTSLPELATSVVASLRGERDIAVGNVVGSNIFNILAVMGASALIGPAGVAVAPAALHFDIPVMIAVTAACLPVFFTGYTISRWEGVLFICYYAAYTTYLILSATHHDALPIFSEVMLLFVIPITALTMAVIVLREIRMKLRR